MRAKDIARFWAKVEKTESCWNWTGAKNGHGYGQLVRSGKSIYVHRYSFLIRGIELPPGKVVDHICRNQLCVRPEHLRLVTPKQNRENLATSSRVNASGIRGVNWDKKAKKWRAVVGHESKGYDLGYFTDLADAENAVVAKRLELHTHNDADRNGPPPKPVGCACDCHEVAA